MRERGREEGREGGREGGEGGGGGRERERPIMNEGARAGSKTMPTPARKILFTGTHYLQEHIIYLNKYLLLVQDTLIKLSLSLSLSLSHPPLPEVQNI